MAIIQHVMHRLTRAVATGDRKGRRPAPQRTARGLQGAPLGQNVSLTQQRLVQEPLLVPGHGAELHFVHICGKGGILGQEQQDDEEHVQVRGRPPRGCVQHVQERQQQHLQITARLQPSLRPQVLLRSSCVSISAPMHRVNTSTQYLSCCHDTE